MPATTITTDAFKKFVERDLIRGLNLSTKCRDDIRSRLRDFSAVDKGTAAYLILCIAEKHGDSYGFGSDLREKVAAKLVDYSQLKDDVNLKLLKSALSEAESELCSQFDARFSKLLSLSRLGEDRVKFDSNDPAEIKKQVRAELENRITKAYNGSISAKVVEHYDKLETPGRAPKGTHLNIGQFGSLLSVLIVSGRESKIRL